MTPKSSSGTGGRNKSGATMVAATTSRTAGSEPGAAAATKPRAGRALAAFFLLLVAAAPPSASSSVLAFQPSSVGVSGGGSLPPPVVRAPNTPASAAASTLVVGGGYRRRGSAADAWTLSAKRTKSAASPVSAASRSGAASLSSLESWARSSGIQVGGVRVSSGSSVADDGGSTGGLGLVSDRDLRGGDVVVQVPTDLALQVESGGGLFDRDVEELLGGRDARRAVRDAPWWVRMSLKVNAVDKVSKKLGSRDGGADATAWLSSLPREFDTPLHWSDGALSELQYGYMTDAVEEQRRRWRAQYDKIASSSGGGGGKMSYDDFVWGCETARSRCFSGPYSGTVAFDPKPYALTLFLVAAYVGGGFGSIEQAANGAALVLCGTILKDFVLPKFLGSRKYVLCPYIDMANHDGTGRARGNVAFEYFADAYSLSVADGTIPSGSELFISYGPRSNDQLLQYYGFVERGNPHDVYVMPPLREWDVEALEEATGRRVMPGRLEKLERAGLLGRDRSKAASAADAVSLSDDDDDDGDNANVAGGVVVTRAAGLDPAILQALRALLSTEDEWAEAGESVGNFAAEGSGGPANERAAKIAARTAMELELRSKPTTREEDEELLRRMERSASARAGGAEGRIAATFRAEKKRVLEEAVDGIRV